MNDIVASKPAAAVNTNRIFTASNNENPNRTERNTTRNEISIETTEPVTSDNLTNAQSLAVSADAEQSNLSNQSQFTLSASVEQSILTEPSIGESLTASLIDSNRGLTIQTFEIEEAIRGLQPNATERLVGLDTSVSLNALTLGEESVSPSLNDLFQANQQVITNDNFAVLQTAAQAANPANVRVPSGQQLDIAI